MNPVVHFEMPYEDRERIAKFYSSAFGWKLQMLGEEMQNYVVAHTDETDEEGMLKENGRINGGFYKKNGDGAYPSFVIAVDDIGAAMKKVKDGGGEIQGEPMDIPGIGRYVSFVDTEGNRNSILQPLPRNK